MDHPSTREQISEPSADTGDGLPRIPADLATKEKLGILLREHGCVVIDSLFFESLPTVRLELRQILAAGRLGDNAFDGVRDMACL